MTDRDTQNQNLDTVALEGDQRDQVPRRQRSFVVRFVRMITTLIMLGILAAVAGVGGILWVFWSYGKGLPDYHQLARYEPPVVTRIHAGDGALLAEYANEKRLFMPVAAIPPKLIHAFISAEDKAFYSHFGVDLRALARASVTNIMNYGRYRFLWRQEHQSPHHLVADQV